jgi:hypothetical protein
VRAGGLRPWGLLLVALCRGAALAPLERSGVIKELEVTAAARMLVLYCGLVSRGRSSFSMIRYSKPFSIARFSNVYITMYKTSLRDGFLVNGYHLELCVRVR